MINDMIRSGDQESSGPYSTPEEIDGKLKMQQETLSSLRTDGTTPAATSHWAVGLISQVCEPMVDVYLMFLLIMAVLFFVYACEDSTDEDEDSDDDDCPNGFANRLIGLLVLALFLALFSYRSYQKFSRRNSMAASSGVALAMEESNDHTMGPVTFGYCMLHTAMELCIYLPAILINVALGFLLKGRVHKDYDPSMPFDFLHVLGQIWLSAGLVFRLAAPFQRVNAIIKKTVIPSFHDIGLVTAHMTALGLCMEGFVRLIHYAVNYNPRTLPLWLCVAMGGSGVVDQCCCLPYTRRLGATQNDETTATTTAATVYAPPETVPTAV